MTYDCMTPDEYALWRNSRVHGGGANPCVDCPTSFYLASAAEGRCCRAPKPAYRDGRPRLSEDVPRASRYATEEARRAARRMTWRDSKRRRRMAA